MYCNNCGFDNAEGSKFCSGCGQNLQITEEPPKQEGNNEATVGNTDIVSVLKMPQNRKKIIAAAVAVIALFFIVKMIGYFNSVEYLEDKLTGNVWYSEVATKNYYYYGSGNTKHAFSFEFHSYGYVEMKGYYYLKSDESGEWAWVSSYGVSEYEWELLEDKTLRIDDEYFEYEKDWSFQGNTLVIEKDNEVLIFSDEDDIGYSETIYDTSGWR